MGTRTAVTAILIAGMMCMAASAAPANTALVEMTGSLASCTPVIRTHDATFDVSPSTPISGKARTWSRAYENTTAAMTPVVVTIDATGCPKEWSAVADSEIHDGYGDMVSATAGGMFMRYGLAEDTSDTNAAIHITGGGTYVIHAVATVDVASTTAKPPLGVHKMTGTIIITGE